MVLGELSAPLPITKSATKATPGIPGEAFPANSTLPDSLTLKTTRLPSFNLRMSPLPSCLT